MELALLCGTNVLLVINDEGSNQTMVYSSGNEKNALLRHITAKESENYSSGQVGCL